MSPGAARDVAADLRACYNAAVAAADPAQVVRAGLEAHAAALATRHDRPHWVIALGKAAPAMAGAAIVFCHQTGRTLAGGIVVVASDSQLATEVDVPTSELEKLDALIGDHPVPGVRSAEAAAWLADVCTRVRGDDVVLVLISGGTSSLIGAPISGIRASDLEYLYALLLGAGLPIEKTNAVRKRFTRWGAGRLAQALQPAMVLPILLSDVPTEDPAMIGSGPISPDPLEAAEIEAILREADLARRIPLSIASIIGTMRSGVYPETPKPDEAPFETVAKPFVVGNTAALSAAAAEATRRGYDPVLLAQSTLEGDATAAGRVLAHLAARSIPGCCLIWGGETTVRLPSEHGLGGRCQQLALAAAEVFDEQRIDGTWMLAAGTDGQDGPSPAAGAIVNASTWRRSAASGAAPHRALARCDAYGALDADDALISARHTGTNVMDLVVAVRV
ncbi:MAG: DUF4147 domain-containing protein [Gemmatimonadaceae bacterium]|nr:DUF4147 domain-containing protein [Gemmatimonadaceae bacterium]